LNNDTINIIFKFTKIKFTRKSNFFNFKINYKDLDFGFFDLILIDKELSNNCCFDLCNLETEVENLIMYKNFKAIPNVINYYKKYLNLKI